MGMVRRQVRRGTIAVVALLTTLALSATATEVPTPRAVALPSAVTAVEVDPALTTALNHTPTASALVQLRDLGARDDVVAAIEATGGVVTLDLPIVDGLAAELTTAGVEALRALPVRALSYDGEVTLAHGSGSSVPEPDRAVRQLVGAARLQRAGYDGSGVGIAFIDTGVVSVPDLAGRVSPGLDLTADGDGIDRYGHGTFVAGVAAGATYGIAPGAHVVPVKIASSDGSSDVSQVLAGLQWVVSERDRYGIGVVNLSLGTDSTQDWRIDPMNYAVERAWASGLVVVVSASNLGPDRGSVTKPADDPWVVAVGATDSWGTLDRADDQVADFSGRGPTRSGNLAKPDLVAPGAHLLGARAVGSTLDTENPGSRVDGSYLQGSGTSFAAAVVSGAAAVLRQAHPSWSPNQIKGALLSSAAAGPAGDPNVDGQGAVDVLAAAKLKSPPVANQGLARSDGTGSLGASRGTLGVVITDTTEQVVETTTCVENLLSGGLLRGLIKTVTCTVTETVETLTTVLGVLDGSTEQTAQNRAFDGRAYRKDAWTASSWSSSQWYGNRWYATSWDGNRWYGNRWYGNRWY